MLSRFGQLGAAVGGPAPRRVALSVVRTAPASAARAKSSTACGCWKRQALPPFSWKINAAPNAVAIYREKKLSMPLSCVRKLLPLLLHGEILPP